MLSESSIQSVMRVRCSGTCGSASATKRSAVSSARRRHAGSGGPALARRGTARTRRAARGSSRDTGTARRWRPPRCSQRITGSSTSPNSQTGVAKLSKPIAPGPDARTSVCCHRVRDIPVGERNAAAGAETAQPARHRGAFAGRQRVRALAGARLHPGPRLDVHEVEVARHPQVGLGGIGHLQCVQRGAALPQRAEVAAHLVVRQEVADREDRRGAVQVPRTNAEIGVLAGARRPQRCKEPRNRGVVMLPASARTLREHARAEGQQAHPMTELEQRVAHRRGHVHCGPPLGRAVHGHRRAGVEQDGPVGHGFGFEPADDRSPPPCRLPPVDVADFVAGGVVAVIEMLDADAGPASDGARTERVRQSFGQQVRGSAREGSQLRLARQRGADQSCRRHPSITEASVVSASTPSSSLSRRRRMRWRNTGRATASRSSTSTCARPAITARTRAMRTTACRARGLAP